MDTAREAQKHDGVGEPLRPRARTVFWSAQTHRSSPFEALASLKESAVGVSFLAPQRVLRARLRDP